MTDHKYEGHLGRFCGAWWPSGKFGSLRPGVDRFEPHPLKPPRRDLGQVLHSQLPVSASAF